jgi:hypothetical protein
VQEVFEDRPADGRWLFAGADNRNAARLEDLSQVVGGHSQLHLATRQRVWATLKAENAQDPEATIYQVAHCVPRNFDDGLSVSPEPADFFAACGALKCAGRHLRVCPSTRQRAESHSTPAGQSVIAASNVTSVPWNTVAPTAALELHP